jgi:hypothetical protein
MDKPDSELVVVLRTADEGLTILAKSILDAEEIPYVLKGQAVQDILGLGRLGGFNYATGPVVFLVHEDDAESARAALQAEGLIEPLESD